MTAPRPRDRPPLTVVTLAVVGVAVLATPLLAVVVEVPWRRTFAVLTAPDVRAALALSLVTPAVAVVIVTLLGVPLAWLLANAAGRQRRLLRALVLIPMVMPPVVAGVALLLAFGRNGLVGGPLGAVSGILLPFTPAGVVLVQVFVGLPFLVVTVEAALRDLDPRLGQLAATLGADRGTVLRRVTLPLTRRAVAAGMVLAWARALGEFGATITFAGNLPGRTQTVPLAVFLELQRDPETAYLLSALMLAVSAAVLIGLRERWVAW